MPRDPSTISDQIMSALPEEERKSYETVQLITEALHGIGFDVNKSPSTYRTPERFLNYLKEFLQPFSLEDILGAGFDASDGDTSLHGLIVQGHIPFTAMCEHHLLPMQGEAFVGYVPNKKVIGLSKMTRLVEAIGHEKPSLQESITERIANAMYDNLSSKGSMVVIRAKHGCMSCRGVNAPAVVTTTSCVRGIFRDVASVREEFLLLAGLCR